MFFWFYGNVLKLLMAADGKQELLQMIWVFPKIGVFPPKSSHLFIGFSIIFTIHFGGFPIIFGLTPI